MFLSKLQVLSRTHGILRRNMAVTAKKLRYKKFGKPEEVLELVECPMKDPKDNEVMVEILAAPINPADIYIIQGKTPIKPKLPATGGSEFVGKVLCVGSKVKNLRVGQRVVHNAMNLGTWRTHANFAAKDVMPISDEIGLLEAATFTTNPPAAYRMLKDFVQLCEGDCIIQNGAMTCVGQAVHQLCKAWNLKSVGVIRNDGDVEMIKKYLKCRGATEVCTEEEAKETKVFKEGCIPKPRLALNCVGGKSASIIGRHLDKKGVMITHGNLSNKPVKASTSALIFRDIRYVGFWLHRWNTKHMNSPQRKEMLKELSDLMAAGKFWAPLNKMVPIEEYKKAISAALDPKNKSGLKSIFDMTSC